MYLFVYITCKFTHNYTCIYDYNYIIPPIILNWTCIYNKNIIIYYTPNIFIIIYNCNSVITLQGEIYVNGIKLDDIRDWYVNNSGYVLQLAMPYYEELTVRENLTLAAQMRLSSSFTLFQKFERIEQVMYEVSCH